MLNPIERPMKDIVSLKVKLYTLFSHLTIQIFFFIMIAFPSLGDYTVLNGITIKIIFLLCFTVAVLTDTNIWGIFLHKMDRRLKLTLSAANLAGYIGIATIFRNTSISLILLVLSSLTLDLINYKNNYFILRSFILSVVSSAFFIAFAGGTQETILSGEANPVFLIVLPTLVFVVIYAHRVVKYSDELISKEMEKRNTTFLHNQISQLEVKQKAAYYDPMTQILNRRGFEMEVHPIFEECKKELKPFALLALDIDHFKKVNDTYGHDKGDVALKTFALAVQETIRPATDAIARVGGEEFIITTIGVDNEERLMAFGERIRKVIERTVWDGDKHFSVSIGAVLFPYSYANSIEELMKKADLALYESKDNGRNRVTIYREAEQPSFYPS